MEARYAALGMQGALTRRCDYAEACKELVTLLKEVYSVAHKSLQASIFQDVMAAIRIMPEMSTSGDFCAANSLVQASELVFPKQKRSIAVCEYKRAAVNWQRSMKHQSKQESKSYGQLPTDLLLHVFSFLDAFSLGTAASVCRAWSLASKEDHLWQKHFRWIIGNTLIDARFLQQAGFKLACKNGLQACRLKDVSIDKEGCWREAFKLASKRWPRLLHLLRRAHCGSCKATFWPSQLRSLHLNNKCSKSGNKDHQHKLRPLSRKQVVMYVLMGSTLPYPATGGSDSDGEVDVPFAKLWEYSKSFQ